jgi:hypothetical protein
VSGEVKRLPDVRFLVRVIGPKVLGELRRQHDP